MNTLEQKAKQWVDDRQTRLPTELDCQWFIALEDAYLAGYAAAQPQWVSVEDRLPEEMTAVLGLETHKTDPYYFVSWRDGPYWFLAEGNYIETTTHWMPLPEPPKEGE